MMEDSIDFDSIEQEIYLTHSFQDPLSTKQTHQKDGCCKESSAHTKAHGFYHKSDIQFE